MGLRFRKSIKVAPGVKLNVGKKSVGMSVGGKHAGVSYNTRSGTHARVSAPGTGVSYTTKLGGKRSGKSKNSKTSSTGKPAKSSKRTSWIAILVVLLLALVIYKMAAAPSAPETITLTAGMEGSSLNIDADYTITAVLSPQNASADSLTFNVDNPSIATIKSDTKNPAQAVLHTKTEGAVSVTAASGDVKSNTITFHIIDKENVSTENTNDSEQAEASETYVLNTSSKKIHHPSCRYAKKIAPENCETTTQTLEELKAQGYDTCGSCF